MGHVAQKGFSSDSLLLQGSALQCEASLGVLALGVGCFCSISSRVSSLSLLLGQVKIADTLATLLQV